MRRIVKRAISRLPKRLLYEVLFQAGRALGVQAIQMKGSQGIVFGPLIDQSITKIYLDRGNWSENILRLIIKTLDNGRTFIDVGANIGLMTIPIAKRPGVQVIAFDPDEGNFALLRANIAYNEVNPILINAAVSDVDGRAAFRRSEYNSGDHHLSEDGDMTVRTVRLDDLEVAPGRLVIKVDTQGAEPFVVRGGLQMLARSDLTIMEFWPWGMRRMKQDPMALLADLARLPGRAAILRHDEPLAETITMDAACTRLASICQSGREYDQVDLVIVGPDHGGRTTGG